MNITEMDQSLQILTTVLVNAFIVLMLFWMTFWDAEPTNPIRRHLIPRIKKPFLWLGLTGEWRMFAPNPPARTIWPMAKLTFEDETVVTWEPTHYSQLGVWEKIKYKKFHKYYYEVTRPNAARRLKRDFIEYLLRQELHEGACFKAEIYLVCQNTRPIDPDASFEAQIMKQLVYTFYPHNS